MHGDGGLVMSLFGWSATCGAIVLLQTLPQAIRTLIWHPSLRTPANMAAAGMAILFLPTVVLLTFLFHREILR
jgi:hypothetical protein